MQITSSPYSLARLPAPSAPRRADARTDQTQASQPASPSVPVRATLVASGLPDDMQQARLRGRPVAANGSFASHQALAQYADVAQQGDAGGRVEVVGIDAYV